MPMVEQTKEIVHKFNNVYGETLVDPDILLPSNQACMRLPGTDGKAKMSKSLGNCIYLSDEPDVVKKKIMSMYTDPDHVKVSDPGKIEGNTVLHIWTLLAVRNIFKSIYEYTDLDQLKAHYQRGGLGDVKVKKFLNCVLEEELEPIRAKRKELEKNIPYIYEILRKGCVKAREKAAETLNDVKNAMKINYFDDKELIKAQSEKYKG